MKPGVTSFRKPGKEPTKLTRAPQEEVATMVDMEAG